MPDYSQGKIYTIRCRNDDSLIYVGSTCQSLSQRFGGHKRCQGRCDKKTSLNNFVEDWNDWYIELYEECKCENKEQLHRKEGEVIRQIATINKLIPGRTQEQRYNENKSNILLKQKQYYCENKPHILQKNKQYRNKHKDRIYQIHKLWVEANKTHKKECDEKYYMNNKEVLLKKNKQYREDNAEKIKQKFTCECGGRYTYDSKSKHYKTTKHQLHLQQEKDKSNDNIDDYNRDKTPQIN